MEAEQSPIHGRGASSNPANRFELIHYERDDTVSPEESPSPATHFYRDHAPSILTRNDSPDLLRLPHGLGPLFEQWLRQHYPERCDKVLSRLRDMRGGAIYDPRFGSRMRGEGVLAEQIANLFALGCRRAGIGNRFPKLSPAAFRRPGGTQRLLFE